MIVIFKFQRIFAGNGNWTDNLFKEDEQIGTLGEDSEGIFVKTKNLLTVAEINLLFAQLIKGDPSILSKKVEFLEVD